MAEGFSETLAMQPAPVPDVGGDFQRDMAISELQHLVNTEIDRFRPYQPWYFDSADGQRLKVLAEQAGNSVISTRYWALEIDGTSVTLQPRGANVRVDAGTINAAKTIVDLDAVFPVQEQEMLYLELTRTAGQSLTAAVLTLKAGVPPDYWPQSYEFNATPVWLKYTFPLYEFVLTTDLPLAEQGIYTEVTVADVAVSLIPRHPNAPLETRLTLYEDPDTDDVVSVPVFTASHASCLYV